VPKPLANARQAILTILLAVLWYCPASPPPPSYGATIWGDGAEQAASLAAADEYSIEVLGAWAKREITVLIIPPGDERYAGWAGLAVDWWANAIEVFTSLYGYEYLRQIRFVKFVKGINGSAGDVVIEYVSGLGERVCGVAYPYIIDGAIRSAHVRLSIECINGRREYALVVTMHEFAHAIGLGHTRRSEDLMYSYVVPGARPSTLDLYGLAIAYSWLRESSFKRPPTSVTLPREIEYIHLLSETGNPVKFRIRVYLQLGEEEVLNRTIIINAGEDLTLTADAVIVDGEAGLKRFAFKDWALRGSARSLSDNLTLTLKPRISLDLVARYEVEYRVVAVGVGGPLFDGWVRVGQKIIVEAEGVVFISDMERLTFKHWIGTINSTSRTLEVVVERPLIVRAVYMREFLVSVSTPYGEPLGTGWWPEGAKVNITVQPVVIELSNDTRLALRGFKGTVEAEGVLLTLNVTEPLRLIAYWSPEFLIVIRSTGGEVDKSLWVENSSVVEVSVPELIDWGNGTRSVFEGWGNQTHPQVPTISMRVVSPLRLTPIYGRLYLLEVVSDVREFSQSIWLTPGFVYRLDVPETVTLGGGLRAVYLGSSHGKIVTIKVEKPEVVRLYWRTEALVSINSPYEGWSSSMWLPIHTTLSLEAPTFIPEGREEALEFDGWRGDIFSDSRTITVTVDRSINLTLNYRKVYRVYLAGDPMTPEELEIVLRDDRGRVHKFAAGSEVWLPGESLEVMAAYWSGVDIKSEDRLRVHGGGTLYVKLDLASIRVRVVDLLGLPAPFYAVTAIRDDFFREASGTSGPDGTVILNYASGHARILEADWLFFKVSTIRAGEVNFIRVPLGMYSLLIASTSAIIAVLFAFYRCFNASATPPFEEQLE